MSELERIEELEKEIRKLKGLSEDGIPSYSFGQIKLEELESLVDIKKSFDDEPFEEWLDNNIDISTENIEFLQNLISKYAKFMKSYNEETLKANFIIPIINSIDFLSKDMEISPFYEKVITYKTDKFILNGATDFLVSRGLEYSRKPYFFIQEFKKGKVNSDPEPQLLAELISAIELNCELSMRGAYIVGENWNFVILEKLGMDKYRYFVSPNFDSTKIEDLKGIYRNLIFVKNEIIEKVRREI
ncbi:MAG: hypothetical protein QM493_08405 [Sulfurovum sp.]